MFAEQRVGHGPTDVYLPSGTGVLFVLTDTMQSRREIAAIARSQQTLSTNRLFLVIETRMASSYGNVYAVNPFDDAQWEAWTGSFVDDDADTTEVSACGASISVGPTAAIIANLAVWQMIHAITNPEAVDEVSNIFCKPSMLTTERFAA